MKKILIIHGVNLDLLGVREPAIYGHDTLDKINEEITNYCEGKKIQTQIEQSNYEGDIVECIHECVGNADGIILNAGAYTHYSIAIRDAIAGINLPCVEVHLTNIYKREQFRQTSVISPVCCGVIVGFGKKGYLLAVDALEEII